VKSDGGDVLTGGHFLAGGERLPGRFLARVFLYLRSWTRGEFHQHFINAPSDTRCH
jgi:hypothetical protein